MAQMGTPVSSPGADVASLQAQINHQQEMSALKDQMEMKQQMALQQAQLQMQGQMMAMQNNAGPTVINNNNNNNNNTAGAAPVIIQMQQQTLFYQDPGCCMKFCCPPCAVFSTYGYCKCPEVLLATALGCFFTVFCWAPSTERRAGAPEGEEDGVEK